MLFCVERKRIQLKRRGIFFGKKRERKTQREERERERERERKRKRWIDR